MLVIWNTLCDHHQCWPQPPDPSEHCAAQVGVDLQPNVSFHPCWRALWLLGAPYVQYIEVNGLLQKCQVYYAGCS